MSNLPIMKRHLPCVLTATVEDRNNATARVRFDLDLPSFRFRVSAVALFSVEALNSARTPEDLLMQTGMAGIQVTLDAVSRAFASLRPVDPVPDLPESSPCVPERPAPLPLNFINSDREWLRELGIEG